MDGYVMTEQPRTIDRRRVRSVAGRTHGRTLAQVDNWLKDFLVGGHA